MFYIRKLQERIVVSPKLLGKRIDEVVKEKIVEEIEGKCTADSGYVISLISIDALSSSQIEPENASATFLVEYSALILLPQKNEVLNAVVHEINKIGIFCFIGPFSIFISMYQIPGHFSEAEESSSILSNDGGPPITKGCIVRVKLIGVKIEPAKIFGIGTLNEDYLGAI
ncbi:DNA-directed RNA polymerase II subunit RPB7 [Nematocida sp. LUAm3]|nr:DNA-directed RNA polymerase II subunit RPB7 [Nematocida sp. LUAm3]KAI5175223.1 DNA-directed RNA polymerase II subunit RPB7 [Nematocida sp. LUAm2]KAI5178105.1 DNA-directed RNA polymerase II subunit RPB7 [Nematocida sp. LUAm1]